MLIDTDVLERALAVGMSKGADFAEVYVEDKRNTSVGLDDGKVESVTTGRDRGAGVRVIAGATTGFAHTSNLTPDGLAAAAEIAAAAARSGGEGSNIVALEPTHPTRRHRVERDPASVPTRTKVSLLEQMDHAAREVSDEIVQVSAGYGDSRKTVQIANSEGVLVSDDVTRVLTRVSAVANGDAGMQTGTRSIGHTAGWEMIEGVDIEQLAADAARQAITKLSARPAPSGELPVVVASGSGGVLFHEACGHGLEADLIAKGGSVFKGRIGELVANEVVTLVDDGTLSGEWGTLSFDDEGHPTQRNVLIENGILTDYMWDHIRAREQGRAPSGNGRRQDYASLPMVRMTNTFVLDGPDDPANIIANTDYGVYVAALGGGQVNTVTGDFVFGMQEAYMIENGKITEPLREGNLIGNGPQVLLDIDMLGNDFKMGRPGTCGKKGQGVPVGDGTPTLRVKALTIGGTAA